MFPTCSIVLYLRSQDCSASWYIGVPTLGSFALIWFRLGLFGPLLHQHHGFENSEHKCQWI